MCWPSLTAECQLSVIPHSQNWEKTGTIKGLWDRLGKRVDTVLLTTKCIFFGNENESLNDLSFRFKFHVINNYSVNKAKDSAMPQQFELEYLYHF